MTAHESLLPHHDAASHSARPLRQPFVTRWAGMVAMVLVLGWAITATSVLMSDVLDAGNASMSQATFEKRLQDLVAERDKSAQEAASAQRRFSVAMEQVSQMQSQLLEQDKHQRELSAGLEALQSDLKIARSENTGTATDPKRNSADLDIALDMLSAELRHAATERDNALAEAQEARQVAEAVVQERDLFVARNDEIFQQLEDAVSVSVAPFEDMFRKLGLDTNQLMQEIDKGYSGTGGPLTPVAYSSSGNADIKNTSNRAQEVIVSLDRVNKYRIATSKLPLAMPVKNDFRFSSGFGPRWGRMHAGMDMAAPSGTPIYATADGVVTFAGKMRGYGNIIKIQHELGTETRFAHLSRIRVKVGQKVSRDALIGDMGNTGRSTGSHLHYEVRVNGKAVNPMSFIKAAQNVF